MLEKLRRLLDGDHDRPFLPPDNLFANPFTSETRIHDTTSILRGNSYKLINMAIVVRLF